MKRILGSTMCILAAFLVISGCEAPGVGDPCIPESIPEGGFVGSEAYLETSSVQCRTRVCMVYRLDGVPFGAPGCETAEQVAMNPDCAGQGATDERVHCTCRCDAPPESTATLCECPDGFACTEVIDQPGAGLGLRGSYCVREGIADPES
jgi:hypothetical protein